MEALFRQAIERRDAAEARMRQQVYSHTAARALIAAGHPPPSWLLPRPAPFAALDCRGAGAVEAQMRQQVEAYSRSLARTLVGASHMPPPWLLPPDAGARALDLRDRAEEQMGKQIVPYSQSLAVGHRPTRRGCSSPLYSLRSKL